MGGASKLNFVWNSVAPAEARLSNIEISISHIIVHNLKLTSANVIMNHSFTTLQKCSIQDLLS